MPVTCRNVCNKREASSKKPPPPQGKKGPHKLKNPPPPKVIKTHRDFFPREEGDERLLLAPSLLVPMVKIVYNIDIIAN